MQDTIITIYCLCDDLLHAMDYPDHPQAKLTNAQVMTVPLVAAAFFGGKIETARDFLLEHHYFTVALSESRLNRRLHALPHALWHTLFTLLGELFQAHNPDQEYVIDSLPVPVCDNIRISRCRLFQGAAYRGYTASKKRYFYGLKVHLVITATGCPVEFVLTPGATADVTGLQQCSLDLPAGAKLLGDRAYNDYMQEDLLQETAAITLQPQRKKGSKRPLPLWLEFVGQRVRQRVETTFSQVTSRFPKHINAVTPQGFILKLMCFLIVCSVHCLV